MANRTALLIRCSKHEADEIRERAKTGRQTISGFVLSIVTRALDFEESLEARISVSPSFRTISRAFYTNQERKVRPRTAILVRCSIEEAERIRAGAHRRGVMIADYVLHCVRRALASGA